MGEVRSLRERNQMTFDGHEGTYPSIYSYRESTVLARLKQRPSRTEEYQISVPTSKRYLTMVDVAVAGLVDAAEEVYLV